MAKTGTAKAKNDVKATAGLSPDKKAAVDRDMAQLEAQYKKKAAGAARAEGAAKVDEKRERSKATVQEALAKGGATPATPAASSIGHKKREATLKDEKVKGNLDKIKKGEDPGPAPVSALGNIAPAEPKTMGPSKKEERKAKKEAERAARKAKREAESAAKKAERSGVAVSSTSGAEVEARQLLAQAKKLLDNGHIDEAEQIVVQGDLGNAAALDALFAALQFDAVMHFAGSSQVGQSMRDPGGYYANNVATTLNLLNTMVRHGCLKLIFSSSAAVYGEPCYLRIDEGHAGRRREDLARVRPRVRYAVELRLADRARAGLHVTERTGDAGGGHDESSSAETS